MQTKLVYHHNDNLFAHPCAPDHPERPHRLAAALSGVLSLEGFDLQRGTSTPAPASLAKSLHCAAYIDSLNVHLHADEFEMLDGGDTMRTADSFHAALSQLGSACRAVDDLMDDPDTLQLVLGRPAGHHACKDRAMGFCLIGQAALAAEYARERYGIKVALLDFDLHHGNGSQDLLWDRPDIFFASSHEIENWPQSGHRSEVGAYKQIHNAPLNSGSGSKAAREAWLEIFRLLRRFKPDMILVSAGFDAHGNDPLSGLNWYIDDYEWLGREIRDAAKALCGGRVLTMLEGGYDLQVLRSGICRYLSGLAGGNTPCPDTFVDVVLDGRGSPYFKGIEGDRTGSGFEVLKRHQRLWICDQENGSLLYTPPSFQALHSRLPLQAVCEAANLAGNLTIGQIIDLEVSQPRRRGYNQGRLRQDQG